MTKEDRWSYEFQSKKKGTAFHSIRLFLESGACPDLPDYPPEKQLRDGHWPIIELLRDYGLALVDLPKSKEEIPLDFELSVDQIKPVAWEFFRWQYGKYLASIGRDNQPTTPENKVTPRKIANMRKNFEKLKAEFEAEQKKA